MSQPPSLQWVAFLLAFFLFLSAAAASLSGGCERLPQPDDQLFVGDFNTDTIWAWDVKGINLRNGRVLVQPDTGEFGIHGVDGIIPYGPHAILLANPENGQFIPGTNDTELLLGNIRILDTRTGQWLGDLVPSLSPNAPFGPRGLIREGDVVYVADILSSNAGIPGPILLYNAHSGQFLGEMPIPNITFGEPQFERYFYPRALVVGPDDYLYVTGISWPFSAAFTGGAIIRFDLRARQFHDVYFLMNDTFNRPDGIVFGPDGNIWVMTFRANVNDTDKIMKITGPCNSIGGPPMILDEIPTDIPGDANRAVAQSLMFGPGNFLFVPVTVTKPDGSTDGEIRRYNVLHNHEFDVVGTMPGGRPFYLTFGKTNPATLVYRATNEFVLN